MTMTTPDVLGRARDLFEPAARQAVASLFSDLRLAAEYHFGWVDADGRPTPGGGKGIRPALAVLGAEAAGGSAADGVPVAVAVELIHNFSLLHDDIIDDDRERRHRPTVWALFGVGDAIIAGDALQTLAFEVLLAEPGPRRVDAARRLGRATQDMITGQAMDMAFDGRDLVSLRECEEMEGYKTGALLAYSVGTGAVLAGADSPTVTSLERYGHHLGLAFQAVDDVLGIWGDPEVTGKPAGNDLRERKKSVPVAIAMDGGGVAATRLVELFAADVTDAGVTEAAALLQAAGAREATIELARGHLGTALDALAAVDLVASAQLELEELARFVVERQH